MLPEPVEWPMSPPACLVVDTPVAVAAPVAKEAVTLTPFLWPSSPPALATVVPVPDLTSADTSRRA